MKIEKLEQIAADKRYTDQVKRKKTETAKNKCLRECQNSWKLLQEQKFKDVKN